MQVTTGDGYTYIIPKQLPPAPIEAVTVVDGKTSLNTSNNNLDAAHLILHGDLTAGHKYIDCQNTNDATVFSVNDAGRVYGFDLQTSNHASINDKIANLDVEDTQTAQNLSSFMSSAEVYHDVIMDRTHENTLGTIVRRLSQGEINEAKWIELDRIATQKIAAINPLPDITLYGQGAICYKPQDAAHQNLPGVYRFGKNVALLGDFTNADGPGDGLFMEKDSNSVNIGKTV